MIWRYTLERWGAAQADLYLHQLDGGIRTLLDFPDLGESCDPLRPGYRKLQVNRHLIFYRPRSDCIESVRVLHQAMDIERHL